MNKWQKLALIGFAGVLLLSFWAGLWYQSKRLVPAKGLTIDAANKEEQFNTNSLEAEDIKDIKLNESNKASELTSNFNDNTEEQQLVVHVVGEVEVAGVYLLPQGSRINDAVNLAKPLEDANLTRLNLALPLVDGMQIRVPSFGDNQDINEGFIINPVDLETKPSKIDINTASQAQLESLPGIGPAYAARILEYRKKNGRFKQVDDLVKIKGIGEKIIDNLRDLAICS